MTVVIALQDRSNPTLRSNLRTDVEIVTARKARDAIRVQRGPFATGEGSARCSSSAAIAP